MSTATAQRSRERNAIPKELAKQGLRVLVTHGTDKPRLAPPLPRTSSLTELRNTAKLVDIRLMKWQEIAGTYLTATTKGRWTFPEVTIVVARQNGKSTILIPRIIMGLLRGERIMHTAQNRELPRAIYHQVAGIMETQFAALLKSRPRYANGQELIATKDGGMYRIVAPNTAGARGYTNDLVIIDEAREMTDFDFIGASRPTLTASKNPQMLYLSNAGDEASAVLHMLRKRAESDPQLAYLEWSAHPDRPAQDTEGWAEANPALGQTITLQTLEQAHTSLPEPVFETEHLCRWVTTMLPRLVSDVAWDRARATVGQPSRPALGLSMDPDGRRASAVLAWVDDGVIYVHLLADHTGYPIDVEAVAKGVDGEPGLIAMQRKYGARDVGFDPWTDRELARHFKEPVQINGMEWRQASERFARAVESGQIRHADRAELTADMSYTVRRETTHGWIAVPASSERPTTASLAAIRAVWLATKPLAVKPRVF